jgi:hypothetical protein
MPDLERAARLRQAREAAGHSRPVDAVNAFGWNRSTYFSHENGQRGIARDRLAVYARSFRVRVEWLAYGQGPMRIRPRRITIEGHLGDLGIIEQDSLAVDEIELIEAISPDEFIAYRLHGNTYYPVNRDRDVVLVPRNHGPPEDYLDKRCVVALQNGHDKLIRTLARGSRAGLFTLLSDREPPLADVEIADAAPIAWTKHEI